MVRTSCPTACSRLLFVVAAALACYSHAEQLTFDDVYGAYWNADGLVPLNIGRLANRTICIRFRAERTGTFQRARFYFIFRKEGYYKGDGGEVLVQFQPDDGSELHAPSGEVLASVHIPDPMAGKPRRLVTFDRPARTKRGKLYHFVFTNPAPDPINNWVSLDQLWQKKGTPHIQPAVSGTDLAIVLRWDNPPWSTRYGHTPIYWIYYEDGSIHGQGYYDARSQNGVRPITGESKVREVFTVSGGDRTVKSVRMRVRKLNDTGSLVVSLLRLAQPRDVVWSPDQTTRPDRRSPRDRVSARSGRETKPHHGGHDGSTVVAESCIPVAEFELGTMKWVELVFPQPLTLANGKTYRLVLSSPDGSYNTFGLVQGTGDFVTPTVFSDGVMEYTKNGKWPSDRPGRMDMQMYFVLGKR